MTDILNSTNPPKYFVCVNGQRIGSPTATKALAEALILQLPPDQQAIAEITIVTAGGASLLLG